mmetsp:Transcript_20501/g.44548  ORF Transcript_20501/g.44548 Transcript_20501/m.44548 type:complete len:451 (+) Transcript_20501:277-1629(+)
MSACSLNWRFRQVFGEKDPVDEPADEDLISAVEFDSTGDYLATGDRGGRVVIFESSEVPARAEQRGSGRRADEESSSRSVQYQFHCEFQSHEPEFDYLKSLEIEERINKIRWRPSTGGPKLLISTNDKTIKLWKIYEKQVKMIMSQHVAPAGAAAQPSALYLPTVQQMQTLPTAALKRIYANGHGYHINALSFNSDGETYLSADDLRINLWSLQHNKCTYNVVDIKPDDMDELSEVITAATFHPKHSDSICYATCKGTVYLCDLREQSRWSRQDGRRFSQAPVPESQKCFFSELIASHSDVKFSLCGRYLMARDYMTLKIWDVNMEREPLRTINVHEHLRSKLCELYESDCIFDKFDCEWSHDSKHVCTGSYDNSLCMWDLNGDGHTTIESVSTSSSPRRTNGVKGKLGLARKDASTDRGFTKKILHHAHHPQRNLVAIGARNSLYIFAA